MARRMGQMAIVNRATRITGAKEVIVDAAFGFAFNQSSSGGRKPPIVVRDVRVQKNDTGKI
jgi:hypothetical protein